MEQNAQPRLNRLLLPVVLGSAFSIGTFCFLPQPVRAQEPEVTDPIPLGEGVMTAEDPISNPTIIYLPLIFSAPHTGDVTVELYRGQCLMPLGPDGYYTGCEWGADFRPNLVSPSLPEYAAVFTITGTIEEAGTQRDRQLILCQTQGERYQHYCDYLTAQGFNVEEVVEVDVFGNLNYPPEQNLLKEKAEASIQTPTKYAYAVAEWYADNQLHYFELHNAYPGGVVLFQLESGDILAVQKQPRPPIMQPHTDPYHALRNQFPTKLPKKKRGKQ